MWIPVVAFLSLLPQDDPEPIRVLYVDSLPRFEYRFLQKALVRDKTVEAQIFLISADPDWEQPASEGVPSLKRENLVSILADPEKLTKYDLVIWGDADPEQLRDKPEYGKKVGEAMAKFVEGGGGLVFHAGLGYLMGGSPGPWVLELLPATLKRYEAPGPDPKAKEWVEQLGEEEYADRQQAYTALLELGIRALAALVEGLRHKDPEIRASCRTLLSRIDHNPGVIDPAPLRRTKDGLEHPALKLKAGEVWKTPPKVRWVLSGVTPAKNSKVLVELEDGSPIVVVSQKGKGRVCLVATDEWWLWRQRGGYYSTYRQLIGWAAGKR